MPHPLLAAPARNRVSAAAGRRPLEVASVPHVTAALLAGLVAGYGVAVPVGAVATYLVSLSARTSVRVGVCAALGIATVDGGYALVAALGGVAGARVLEPIAGPLHWVSVAVLLTLALMTAATAARAHHRASSEPSTGLRPTTTVTSRRAFAQLVAATAVNPATVVYFVALAGARADRTAGLPPRLAFAVGAFVASASWQAALAGAGAVAGKLLTGRRAKLITALVSSALVTVLALRLAVSP